MRYNALIFDLDGTLVDNMPVHNKVLEATLLEAGVQLPADPNQFYSSMYGRKTVEVFRMLLGPDVPNATVQAWADRKEARYREEFARQRQPLPGLLPLLDYAQALGLPMAIASAAPPENISYILDELNLRRYFKTVLSSHNIRHGKPDPEIFLKAAHEMGVETEDCLVFEDGLHGIEAARRAGMDAVLICTSIPATQVAGQSHAIEAVPDFSHLDLYELLE